MSDDGWMWFWLAVITVGVLTSSFVAVRFHGRANRHRAREAPPAEGWDSIDLFRPDLYTEEGNRLRRIALILAFPVPIAWTLFVVLLTHLVAGS